MENDDTENGDSKTPNKLHPSGSNINTDNDSQKTKKRTRKSQPKKRKTLWEYWKNANAFKKFEMSLLAIGSAIGIAYVGVTVWGNLQSKWHFSMEHRPRVIFSRAPELLGQFECEVTDKEVLFRSGQTHVWLKNVKSGDAVDAFISGINYRLISERKTGEPIFDTPPEITGDTCHLPEKPKMKQFPINAGQELYANMASGIGTQWWVPSTSATVDFNKPINPASPLGGKSGALINRDDLFQLYAPVCVYYLDEEGGRHGTCMTYRLNMDDRYTFSCTQTPISGKFEQIFSGYCED